MSAVIISTMRYQDAPKAIDFLCDTFGFKKHMVHQEEDGSIPHAQLLFGNAMIMVSSIKESDFDKLVKPPNLNNHINSMSPYIILDEETIEAHYEKAQAVGAEIVFPIKEQPFGGKAYSCKDTEGYLWNFGSYDPWK